MFFINGAGYVATEPRVNQTQSGLLIMNFSMPIKGKDDDVQWLKCSMFGKGAEYAKDKVRKGTFVAINGQLKPFSYTNKSGETVTGLECNIAPFGLSYPKDPAAQAAPTQARLPAPVSLDDIPF